MSGVGSFVAPAQAPANGGQPARIPLPGPTGTGTPIPNPGSLANSQQEYRTSPNGADGNFGVPGRKMAMMGVALAVVTIVLAFVLGKRGGK